MYKYTIFLLLISFNSFGELDIPSKQIEHHPQYCELHTYTDILKRAVKCSGFFDQNLKFITAAHCILPDGILYKLQCSNQTYDVGFNTIGEITPTFKSLSNSILNSLSDPTKLLQNLIFLNPAGNDLGLYDYYYIQKNPNNYVQIIDFFKVMFTQNSLEMKTNLNKESLFKFFNQVFENVYQLNSTKFECKLVGAGGKDGYMQSAIIADQIVDHLFLKLENSNFVLDGISTQINTGVISYSTKPYRDDISDYMKDNNLPNLIENGDSGGVLGCREKNTNNSYTAIGINSTSFFGPNFNFLGSDHSIEFLNEQIKQNQKWLKRFPEINLIKTN